MLLQYSYYCFLAFIVSSFLSPTLRTVFLIAGLVLWGVSLLRGLQAAGAAGRSNPDWIASPSARNDVKLLTKLLIAYIFVNLVLDLIHGEGILPWLKSLVSTYAQWFWALTVIARSGTTKQSSREAKPSNWIASLALAMTQRGNLIQGVFGIQVVIIAASSLLSLIVMLQLFGLLPLAGEYYGVLSQSFTSSGLILIGFFVTLLSLRSDSLRPQVFGVSLFIQLIALFALGQRSVWTGLILALIFYLIVTKQYINKSFWITVILVLITGVFVISSSERVERKVQRFVNPYYWTNANSIVVRKELWELNKQAWQAKPLIGINKIIEYEGLNHAHNIYLQQLYTGGWLRLLTWLSFYLLVGFFLLGRIKVAPEFFASYLAISIEGFLENWWGDGEVLTLFLVMVILAMKYKKYI